ncbi:22056_t:CDS:2, partial [Cetraspora pellucida]
TQIVYEDYKTTAKQEYGMGRSKQRGMTPPANSIETSSAITIAFVVKCLCHSDQLGQLLTSKHRMMYKVNTFKTEMGYLEIANNIVL